MNKIRLDTQIQWKLPANSLYDWDENIAWTKKFTWKINWSYWSGWVISNVAIWDGALNSNTTWSYNTAIWNGVLYSNTTWSYNTAIWNGVLYSNTTWNNNTANWYLSLKYNRDWSRNTANWYQALHLNTAWGYNTANWMYALFFNTTWNNNTANWTYALVSNTTWNNNIAIWNSALHLNTTWSNNTANWYQALKYKQDWSDNTNLLNCSWLWNDTRVSWNNQIQLWNADTTTYVYWTVQNRSDIRDKTEIRETSLWLDFISKINPVEYKFDYRDNYFNKVEEEKTREIKNINFNSELEKSEDNKEFITETYIETKLVKIEKDWSRAWKRFHQWVIAQQVKEVIDKLWVDFGWFQDHSISWWTDVMSIWYDEFIAPLIKSIQELKARIEILEAK